MSPISLPLLDQVRIAAPCDVPWSAMTGDDLTRCCDRCSLTVNNLSGLTRPEAEAFLQSIVAQRNAGDARRVCVHFYRRHDGTILTQDCPVGLALLRRRFRIGAARAVAAVGVLCASVAAFGSPNWRRDGGPRIRQVEPFRTVAAWLAPKSTPPPVNTISVPGEVCVPTTPPSPTPGNAGSATPAAN